MSDYEQDLLNDLDSDSDTEVVESNFPDEKQPSARELSFDEKLDNLLASNNLQNHFKLVQNDFKITSKDQLHNLSSVLPLIPELSQKLVQFSDAQETDYQELISSLNEDISPEYKFILSINELSTILNQEIALFLNVLKVQYKVVFPELETLILNPIDYARIIMIIKQDLANIKLYEPKLKEFIPNEKVLVVIMAALQQVPNQFPLVDEDFNIILDCCDIIFTLDDILYKLSQFISTRISKFAPNVSAIIGPITTSQMLISVGSLKQLAMTPSCNLASLGVKDLSTTSGSRSNFVRQRGYLYHCDLLKYLPNDIIRPVMRIISGKIILAARIDLSQTDSDGLLGRKYLEEIQVKIDKLLAPPEQQPDKALPVPIEQKSKKRGGRRFRKMKERFQMSELRKSQNKMQFGIEEETIMDGYGNEIGLGMSGKNYSGISKIKVNKNTNAKMSKAMAQRLRASNEASTIESDMIVLPKASTDVAKETASTNSIANKWFNGMTK